VASKLVDEELLPFLNFELLTSYGYDCEHDRLSLIKLKSAAKVNLFMGKKKYFKKNKTNRGEPLICKGSWRKIFRINFLRSKRALIHEIINRIMLSPFEGYPLNTARN
jgi:hypothetical protein